MTLLSLKEGSECLRATRFHRPLLMNFIRKLLTFDGTMMVKGEKWHARVLFLVLLHYETNSCRKNELLLGVFSRVKTLLVKILHIQNLPLCTKTEGRKHKYISTNQNVVR